MQAKAKPNSFACLTTADAQTLRIRLRYYAELYNLSSHVITCDAVFPKLKPDRPVEEVLQRIVSSTSKLTTAPWTGLSRLLTSNTTLTKGGRLNVTILRVRHGQECCERPHADFASCSELEGVLDIFPNK